jgi:hypothetical protein
MGVHPLEQGVDPYWISATRSLVRLAADLKVYWPPREKSEIPVGIDANRPDPIVSHSVSRRRVTRLTRHSGLHLVSQTAQDSSSSGSTGTSNIFYMSDPTPDPPTTTDTTVGGVAPMENGLQATVTEEYPTSRFQWSEATGRYRIVEPPLRLPPFTRRVGPVVDNAYWVPHLPQAARRHTTLTTRVRGQRPRSRTTGSIQQHYAADSETSSPDSPLFSHHLQRAERMPIELDSPAAAVSVRPVLVDVPLVSEGLTFWLGSLASCCIHIH